MSGLGWGGGLGEIDPPQIYKKWRYEVEDIKLDSEKKSYK